MWFYYTDMYFSNFTTGEHRRTSRKPYHLENRKFNIRVTCLVVLNMYMCISIEYVHVYQ